MQDHTRNLGLDFISTLLLYKFKLLAIMLALVFFLALVITVIGLEVFGVARSAKTTTPNGGVAGLPPSADFLAEIPPDQLAMLKSVASVETIAWEVLAAIIRIESNFGKKGDTYAGLSDSQWDTYAQILTQPRQKADSKLATQALAKLLAKGVTTSGEGGAVQSSVKSFKPDDHYYYRVLQVAGRYGYILPGSFEEKVVNLAKQQLGKPYIWAATGPDTFDCSGLTLYVHQASGVIIPRNSEAQYFGAEPITTDQVMPGDMFFLELTYADPHIRITHVGIYIGGGMTIHAPVEGDVVKYERVDSPFFRAHWYGFARAKRPGMLPPTKGLGEETDPISGDWRNFDVTQGEPKPQAIDNWLETCGGQGVRSPQLNEAPVGETIGQVYIRMGRQYGINPAYAAVFFTKESSCGNFGDNLASHNFGNIRWTPGYPTLDRVWRAYPNWSAGMEDWFRLIKTEYVGRGLKTVDQIVPVYAPSFENDTSLYIQQVKSRVISIMSS
jgi:cell wall-associated NlpC family hydrolase